MLRFNKKGFFRTKQYGEISRTSPSDNGPKKRILRLGPPIDEKVRVYVRKNRYFIKERYRFDVLGRRKPDSQHHTLFGKLRWWFRENITNDIVYGDIHGTKTTNGKVREGRNIVLWKVATGRNISWGEQPVLNDALYELKYAIKAKPKTVSEKDVKIHIKKKGIPLTKVVADIQLKPTQDYVVVTCHKSKQETAFEKIENLNLSRDTCKIGLRKHKDERFADFELKWQARNRNRGGTNPLTIILYAGSTAEAASYFVQLKHKLNLKTHKFTVLWVK